MIVDSQRRQAGFSLIELMIASVIGLLLLSGLSLLFVNSSESNRELQKASQQIENGRFAIDILSQNLRLAGFYGHLNDFSAITAPATVPPNPCEINDTAALLSATLYPVQAYAGTVHATTPANDAAAAVPAACGALTAANLKAGSDVLVIRRADTNVLAATATAVNGGMYIQSSPDTAEIQIGNGQVIGSNKASGGASVIKLTNGSNAAAPIRRFHVHVYFVAPCSVGTDVVGGVSGVCRAVDDAIPTLKRLELAVDPADNARKMMIVPLVEGIEYIKYLFGVDDTPVAVNASTGTKGDASVDSYKVTALVTDWREVIAAKVYVLARNTEASQGYVDNKTYLLGTIAVPARNDGIKRHVYGTAVHLMNPGGRREIP